MTNNIFELKNFFNEMDGNTFAGRRTVSENLKTEERGGLRTFMGDYGKQKLFEEMLGNMNAIVVNRFFDLIPQYTLRENLMRSGADNSAIELVADELRLTKLLDEVTVCTSALDQEKAAIALAILKKPTALGFINTSEGLSHGEELYYYDAVGKMCKRHGVNGLLFITKYSSGSIGNALEKTDVDTGAVCVSA